MNNNDTNSGLESSLNQASTSDNASFPVEFEPEAVAAARDLQAKNPAFQGQAVRVYLSGKGCDGFEYGVTFDDPGADDFRYELNEMTFVVDQETAKFVRGSSVVWVDDERGKGFLVENPSHRKFRGKFFKRKGWEERLETALQSAVQGSAIQMDEEKSRNVAGDNHG